MCEWQRSAWPWVEPLTHPWGACLEVDRERWAGLPLGRRTPTSVRAAVGAAAEGLNCGLDFCCLWMPKRALSGEEVDLLSTLRDQDSSDTSHPLEDMSGNAQLLNDIRAMFQAEITPLKSTVSRARCLRWNYDSPTWIDGSMFWSNEAQVALRIRVPHGHLLYLVLVVQVAVARPSKLRKSQ